MFKKSGFCVLFLAAFFQMNIFAALPGSGSPDDPWRITQRVDFAEFVSNSNYWSGYTNLESDLDLSGTVYDGACVSSFSGSFDGGGHKIENLEIASPYGAGLFGELGNGAVVKNIRILGCNIVGASDGVGGICGVNRGADIINCHVTGMVSGNMQVGGLCGYNESQGRIINCSANCQVSGDQYVGGICGQNGMISGYDTSLMHGCRSSGSVSGQQSAGGLFGLNTAITASCTASGPVAGESYIGGLGGKNLGIINFCNATGNVQGGTQVGGLLGFNSGLLRGINCSGAVKARIDSIGGLCGVNNGKILEAFSISPVECNAAEPVFVGALLGLHIGENALVVNSFWSEEVCGEMSGYNLDSIEPGRIIETISKSTAQLQNPLTFTEGRWTVANFDPDLRAGISNREVIQYKPGRKAVLQQCRMSAMLVSPKLKLRSPRPA